MNLLITGGSGFIGSAACRFFAKDSTNKIVNLDALVNTSCKDSLASVEKNPNYVFVEGNINDTSLVRALLRQHKITAIIHLAAESHVDKSIAEPEQFLLTNILGTYSLLEASRYYLEDDETLRSRFRFLHVSTDEVYGDLTESDPAFSENNPYDPSSPYSASKAASDHLVSAWSRTYGIPTVITNCSNNYGPYQFPEKLIPHMIISALNNKNLPVYGDGQNIRDWLHVDDHVRALARVLLKGHIGKKYNIGGNAEKRNIEVVNLICKTLDELSPRPDGASYLSQIRFVKDRLGHDSRYAVNCKKICDELNWQPEHDFELGIRQTISWYLENGSWWKNVYSQNEG